MKYNRLPFSNAEPSITQNTEPILIVAGFGEDMVHMRGVAEALEANGSKTFVSSSYELNTQQVSTDVFERVYGISHSLGAISLLDAAIEEPERFISLTLMQPMGLIPNQSLADLIVRSGRKFANNQSEALKLLLEKLIQPETTGATTDQTTQPDSWDITSNQLRSAFSLARNPCAAIKEVLNGTQADIREKIKTVRGLNIPVGVILSASDELFDANVVHQNCLSLVDDGVTYTWLTDRTARHDTFWLQPNRTARMIRQIIDLSIGAN